MKYTEVKIETPGEKIEEVTARLMNMGIEGLAIDDPRETVKMLSTIGETEWFDEGEIWKEAEDREAYINAPAFVSFYLQEEEPCLDEIQEAFSDFNVTWKVVDDEDWKDKWKEYFHPTKVTSRIVVSPTWASPKELESVRGEEDIVIHLDPGTAFGTGTHESTSLTLGLMEESIDQGKAQKVLDVGTGSGILAIAAIKLGAKEVLAIDIDEDSVQAAKENISLNIPNPESIKVALGDLTKGVDYKADIIVANLLSDLVIRFAPDAAKHLAPGGIFISSGILIEKQSEVVKAIEKAGFRISKISEAGDWCAILAELI